MINILISILFFSIPLNEPAGFNERYYAAYISGEMESWHATMRDMEKLSDMVNSNELLYDLSIAQYGYIAYCLSSGKDKEARVHISKAEENLKQLSRNNFKPAKVHALRGAIYGFKVGVDPYKAIIYGRRAFSENNKAMDLAPDDPQVWMEKGNIELYKPPVFGPDSHLAASHYHKAIMLFEEDPLYLKDNWLYLNALANLARAYVVSEQYEDADRTYRKILDFEPGMEWIRDEVYPAFQRKYSF